MVDKNCDYSEEFLRTNANTCVATTFNIHCSSFDQIIDKETR